MGIKRRHFNQYISLLEKHVSTSNTHADGVIVCVSEAFCEMTCYSESELIGQKHNLYQMQLTIHTINKKEAYSYKAHLCRARQANPKRCNKDRYRLIFYPTGEHKALYCFVEST